MAERNLNVAKKTKLWGIQEVIIMVLKVMENFQCEACGLKYREKEIAEKCEAWCTAHNSCNLEITRHAVQ